MENLTNILPFIQITLAVLLVAAILIQQTGNDLGGAFGGGDNFSARHTRRGAEKIFFYITVTLAILFVASAFIALII
ncbi:TPA: preprotein translocase subunit SecG [Candidatus Campbellbacteria bacterium]|uniref:Protein-export membrane protein SecG n=2 Tax=Candidatus Campbelliibacteriota TaxID=1752727 RepID=A0A1F5EPL5_9BACT|nr:MAG: Preprotein translocase SecG subunit [Candidatus Campbellbacteria bacterium GW2011_OD1_34_28]OGD68097.1 MAG: preprotein translocase subunit SecG [Candidatus Campbellbacteria bacterium RIFCSPHIGHO2_01_FULL_34_10]OGD69338.1 MAG: preprotein translocase subunit SecG [Candidatus Campbellbacteria bacterium RIFCSPLOWO2_01_FULL_34_15]HAP74315.1 preprotein translocase subunit SecG [Candidatus Campbellbacteria bacterium]HAQ01823.1 preprotein translocase subunit SecG [Candidatus Campbellbacteria ba